MDDKRVFLAAAAAVGLIGIGVWRAGTFWGAAALLAGACLLIAAAALIGRREVRAHRQARTDSRWTDSRSASPIVEMQGWTVAPELDESVIRTLHACGQSLQHMREIALLLEDERVAGIIGEMCRTGEAIFAKIRRHPERLSSVQRFFDYHLPATASILDKYTSFLHSDVYTNEMEYQVKQIEGLLLRIRRHFRKDLERLMRDDLLDAEIEVNAFDRVMRSEGL